MENPPPPVRVELPRGTWFLTGFLLLVVLDRSAALLGNPYLTQILTLVAINVILAVSLNLINGFTGQFSLGHAGFMAIGAYLAAALCFYTGAPALAFLRESLGLPAPAAKALFTAWLLLAGGAAAALVGLVVGIPSLRLQGDYLAIATLGFGEIIRIVILNVDAVGGPRGFSVRAAGPALDVRLESLFGIYGATALTVLALARLAYSIRGRAYLCVRDDETAAASIGISPARVKTEAFVAGSFFAGVAGVLFALSQGYVHTNSFTFLKSLEAVVFVVLGGMGSITGCILAAAALTVAPELLRKASEYRMIAYSLVLIVMMLLRPQGLFGMREFTWESLRRLWERAPKPPPARPEARP